MTTPLPAGRRVVLPAFAETPLDAIASMTLESMPPPAAKEGEVLVRIKSAAVGWVDLLMTTGQYQHVPKPPYCPGLEYAGEVVGTGQRVIVDPFLAGPRSLGDYQRWGGFATYAIAPKAAILPIPSDLSFDQAASLLGSYETAYHCLVTRGRLREGETVLIHGASGATGLAAVHVAKQMGATVIATGRSEAKLEIVKAQGADHVVASGGGFKDAVKALTGGKGVDVVYDAVGGDVSLESMRCVKFGARFLVVGWASTPFVARKGNDPNVVPTNLIMMKGLDVLGCPTAISTAMDPSSRAPRLAQILRWAESGAIRPHVSHAFELERFADALRAKWRGEVVGGCVLHP